MASVPPNRRTSGAARASSSSTGAGPSAAANTGDESQADGDSVPCPEVLRSQPLESTRYLDPSLPPMHKLDEIYQDLVENALSLGFDQLMQQLAGRPLRVATVCSGTESPLLALEMIQKVVGVDSFRFLHDFSCEIVPFKQAYIERNFSPPLLFRDFCELGQDKARTAYGSLEDVPGGLDMLVAGTACVDFSGLNTKRKSQASNGESMSTFNALVSYADRYRPRIMVLENVRGAPWGDFSSALKEIDYCSQKVNVDSKEYYIPQTRQRGYMVAFDKRRLEGFNQARLEKILADFEGLVDKFKRPASSPAGMFCLEEEDARREQIDKDLSTRLEAGSSRVEKGWDAYQIRHTNYRISKETGDQRPISRSQRGGVTCCPPEFYLQSWFAAQVERIWDTIDIKQLIGIGHSELDINFKERWIDLSQGVDRGGENTAAFGVAGCLTPSGMPFVSTHGALLSGLEALALQGLPIDRMLLTRESQRECQDLAGNAMTSTVVCVAMLSALIAGSQVLDQGALQNWQADVAQGMYTLEESHTLSVTDFPPPAILQNQENSLGEPSKVAPEVEVRLRGWKSARFCVCEKQSGLKPNPVECILCGHTACSSCAGNPAHSYKPITRINATNPLDFMAFLKSILPMRIELTGLHESNFWAFEGLFKTGWSEYLDAIEPAVTGRTELRFVDIKRTHIWTIIYESQHCHMHLEITRDAFQWLYFAKIPSTLPVRSLVREILAKPIARMIPTEEKFIEGYWQVCAPISTRISLSVTGIGQPTQAYAASLGITKPGVGGLQVFPTIRIDASDYFAGIPEVDIRGEYQFLPDCGTALGCLYISTNKTKRPIFLFLDPRKVGRVDHDSFVFAFDPERNAGYNVRLTIAEMAHTWRATTVTNNTESIDAFCRTWDDAPWVNLRRVDVAEMEPISLSPKTSISVGNGSCLDSYVPLAGIRGSSELIEMHQARKTWEPLRPEDTQERLKTLTWAVQNLSSWNAFAQWSTLRYSAEFPISEEPICVDCNPPTPKMLWGRDKNNRVVPYEDPRQAAVWERAVRSKPKPFVGFNRRGDDDWVEFVIALNIQSLAHTAYSKLAYAGGTNVSFEWRLVSNYRDLGRKTHPRHTILCNKDDPQAANPPNFLHILRSEQLRSLTWMINQENEDMEPFTEKEVEEACFPLLTWRAEVRAEMPKTIRGGVLADEVGYGKTAIVLGLVDHGFNNNTFVKRLEEQRPEVSGLIPVKGTLILVPDNVFLQWTNEIEKFLGNRYKVLEIPKIDMFGKLQVKDIQQADIILVSWKVVQSPKYYQILQSFAGAPQAPRSCGRFFDSWFREASSSMRELVKTLASRGPEDFLRDVTERRQQGFENQEAGTYVPSRRLRGQAFADAQKAKATEDKDTEDSQDQAAEAIEAEDELASYENKWPLDSPLKRRRQSKKTNPTALKHSEEVSPDNRDGVHVDLQGKSNGESKKRRRVSKAKGKTVDPAGITEEEFDPDVSNDQSVEDQSKKRKRTPKKEVPPSEENDRKIFNIPKRTTTSATKRKRKSDTGPADWQDWRDMKNLPFHAFQFERFVIDEYTYIGEDRRVPLVMMNARSKWILSGTPALNDFADVKSIAQYLGLHLGVDDDGDIPTQNMRLKTIFRNMTAAEKFTAFQPRHSHVWHAERHEHSQRFINRFMRQNKAEIKHIPVETHFHVSLQSDKEKDLYQKLHAHFFRTRGHTRKMRVIKNTQTPEDEAHNALAARLNPFLEGVGLPEESLLQCSTTPSFDRDKGLAGSTKLAELVSVIADTAEDEYVVLFVQFEEVMHVVAHFLEYVGITYGMATTKNNSILKLYAEPDPTKSTPRPRKSLSKPESDDEPEPEDEPEDEFEDELDDASSPKKGKKRAAKKKMPKVLMLHLGSAMAAGLNLQMINHVIFLSPLVSATQHEYEAGMTQAIGRCRRYGQKRTVHVHHMMSMHTADVNVFQDRNECVVVLRGGEAIQVGRDEVLDDDERCQGPELNWEQ